MVGQNSRWPITAVPHSHAIEASLHAGQHCRYSVSAGVRNRKDPDFGTSELWLLDKIQEVCSSAGFEDPVPAYKSKYKLAQEKGGYPQRG